MRPIDADELLEHAYRDKLDSRELIADMINNAPTIKEIPIKVPLDLVFKALEQESSTDVLNKITTEIREKEDKLDYTKMTDIAMKTAYIEVLKIIDKYRQVG